MNTNQKGKKAVEACRKLCLETMGLEACQVVERRDRHVRKGESRDLFGLFDLCGYHSCGDIYFIQVKTNRPDSHYKFQEFADMTDNNIVVIQAVMHDGNSRSPLRGWKVYAYGNSIHRLEAEIPNE